MKNLFIAKAGLIDYISLVRL